MSFASCESFRLDIRPFYKASLGLDLNTTKRSLNTLYNFLIKEKAIDPEVLMVDENDSIENVIYFLASHYTENTEDLLYSYDSTLQIAKYPDYDFDYGLKLPLEPFSILDKRKKISKVLWFLVKKLMVYIPAYESRFEDMGYDYLDERLEESIYDNDEDWIDTLKTAVLLRDKHVLPTVNKILNNKYDFTYKECYEIGKQNPLWNDFIISAIEFLNHKFSINQISSFHNYEDDNEMLPPRDVIGWMWNGDNQFDSFIYDEINGVANEFGVDSAWFLYDLNNYNQKDYEKEKAGLFSLIKLMDNEFECFK